MNLGVFSHGSRRILMNLGEFSHESRRILRWSASTCRRSGCPATSSGRRTMSSPSPRARCAQQQHPHSHSHTCSRVPRIDYNSNSSSSAPRIQHSKTSIAEQQKAQIKYPLSPLASRAARARCCSWLRTLARWRDSPRRCSSAWLTCADHDSRRRHLGE